MKKYTLLCTLVLVCALILTGCQSNTTATTSNTVSATELIKDIPTVQAFTDEAVAQADIDAIVAAGMNAPSAMNTQPWHFSVITDKEVLESLSGNMGDFAAPPQGFNKPEGMPEGFEMPQGMPEGMTPPEGFEMPQGMPEGMAPPEGFEMPQGMPEGMTPPEMGSRGAKAGLTDAPLVIVVSCKAGSEFDAGLATQNMSAEAQLLGYGTKLISSPKDSLNANKEALGIPDDMSVVCVLLVGKTDTANYDAISSATPRNALNEVVTFVNK